MWGGGEARGSPSRSSSLLTLLTPSPLLTPHLPDPHSPATLEPNPLVPRQVQLLRALKHRHVVQVGVCVSVSHTPPLSQVHEDEGRSVMPRNLAGRLRYELWRHLLRKLG